MFSLNTLWATLVVILSLVVRVHLHGMKLVVLAAIGVIGLYMMHKLAQDYTKYQQLNKPAKALALAARLIGKRSLPDDTQTYYTDYQMKYGDNFQFMSAMLRKALIPTLLLILAACVKASTYHLLKVLALLVIGLAGVYMIRLLSMDFQKIQNANRPAAKFLFKRSLAPDGGSSWGESQRFPFEFAENDVSPFETILNFDPKGCAQRYVCIIATKKFIELSQDEQGILQLISDIPRHIKMDKGQSAFVQAMELGSSTRTPGQCAKQYPNCGYTITQMLKLIGLAVG